MFDVQILQANTSLEHTRANAIHIYMSLQHMSICRWLCFTVCEPSAGASNTYGSMIVLFAGYIVMAMDVSVCSLFRLY